MRDLMNHDPTISLRDLLPILQVAIGPVILISGVGLLLVVMTNRFGRIIDRVRQLSHDLRAADSGDKKRIVSQLQILSRRARIVRSAIALAAISVLLAALLIIVLFLTALLNLGIVSLISGLFIACLFCLIISLILFIVDVNISLVAVRLEIESIETET